MKTMRLVLCLFAALSLATSAFANFEGEPPAWAYDAGPLIFSDKPDVKKLADELVELNAGIPYFPGVSWQVMGEQKFRPAFGPISWRMLLEPNSVKILFIGQDGTHIAEAAGRPATAGFGGRAHDLANHFGVDYSAAFINTYAFTIRGQYGDRGVPYLKNNRLNFTSQYLDNELWLISQDLNSPIVQWRNNLIDWIIRNNKESLRLIVTFGGSARDSIASYIESKDNGQVGTRLSPSQLRNVRIPEYRVEYAGGNNTFPVPIDRYGNDLYEKLLGRKPNYKPPYEGVGAPDDQQEVQQLLANNLSSVLGDMVFSGGGLEGSGLLHPAQLGGYDIRKIEVNGRETISLKGLRLSDGTEVPSDVLVVDLPHPTYLSNVQRSQGNSKVSNLVDNKTEVLEWWKDRGWYIEPDHGFENANFFRGGDYSYGRGEIGQEYYDFGTPANRMVSVSDAKRVDAESILLGAREDTYLNYGQGEDFLQIMKRVEPAEEIDGSEMFISISRTTDSRVDFDPGPGEELARIMKESLYGEAYQASFGTAYRNLQAIYDLEINQINWKVADFGHYRGQPKNAKVVVLADPDGWDSVMTARALTGERGQYLQHLLANGITEADYSEAQFVLHTVPFGTSGFPERVISAREADRTGEKMIQTTGDVTESQWVELMALTKKYREEVLKYVFDSNPTIDLILTDGPYAKQAIEDFLAENPSYADKAPVVWIERSNNNRNDMEKALAAIRRYTNLETDYEDSFQGRRSNIPSKHLSYYARVWEGTSGDRVITSAEQPGIAFGQVVPEWVVDQRVSFFKVESPYFTKPVAQLVDDLKNTLCVNALPLPGEDPDEFLDRKADPEFPQCQAAD